jgi:hypothetical protein
VKDGDPSREATKSPVARPRDRRTRGQAFDAFDDATVSAAGGQVLAGKAALVTSTARREPRTPAGERIPEDTPQTT